MTSTAAITGAGARVVTGALHRVRRGKGMGFAAEAPPAPEPAPAARPARVAITLALAHKLQQAIDRGEVRDRAEVARRLGMTRARVTQILDLCLLSPRIQEEILAGGAAAELSERALRKAVGAGARRECVQWRVGLVPAAAVL